MLMRMMLPYDDPLINEIATNPNKPKIKLFFTFLKNKIDINKGGITNN